MDKLAKLEAFINKYLAMIFGLFAHIGHEIADKVIPEKIRKRTPRPKQTKSKDEIKEFWIKKFKAIRNFLGSYTKKIGNVILLASLKFRNIKAENFHPKNFFGSLYYFFHSLYLKIAKWISGFRPETITAFAVIMSLTYLIGIELYNSSKKIADANGRSPASEIVPVIERRPAYYKISQREWEIYMVNFPVYIGGPADLRSLVIDFSVLASNQYIKLYLTKNEHLVKDRLNLSVEPVLPSFPLEEEGRIILKDKIRYEMNQLLNDLKIEGEIEEINLINVLSN